MNSGRSWSTAHTEWDRRWQHKETRDEWRDPEPLVADSVPFLKERNVRDVLDIGCGVGRHALFLAQNGFQVTAVDLSESGLQIARDTATEMCLEITFTLGDFTSLPVPDDSCDLALAWNVIYHGDGAVVQQALDEIQRVLRPGGILICTMISTRHERYGDGTEVRPNTFIVEDDDEKAHAHFYCDDQRLVELIRAFQLFQLQDRQQRGPGTWHWEFLAQLRAST